ncbi:MAG: GyrI-like domain-containing protein [Rectinemataceae bacterium]
MIAIKEFKETDPWDYSAEEDRAQVLTLPNRRFAWIEGGGDPNGPVFAAATTALYGLSYAVRMSYRSEMAPQGSGPYTVGVLQGRWDIAAGESFFDPAHKGKLTWVIMIRQPDFLDEKLFTRFREEARAKAIKKKTIESEYFDRLCFGERDGGRYAQILHRGPYADESKTFTRLEEYLSAQGLHRDGKWHWELYHGDPRRVAPAKLKTFLRVQLCGAPTGMNDVKG